MQGGKASWKIGYVVKGIPFKLKIEKRERIQPESTQSLYLENRVRLARFNSFFRRLELVLDERQFSRNLVRFRVGVFGDEPRFLQLRHQLVHPLFILLAPVIQDFADAE